MIAAKSNGIAVESTLTGQSIAMGIKAENMQHIMSLMIDMYSDPQLAVIREYSTNARDAIVEAGGNAPIDVTTPTTLSPFFKVKDSGVGLTVEDIHDIYSQYGSSTKRSTNDQVGMLGLGCKSALTYTNQFTVTSIKDGTRITVVVSRDEAGRGSMQVVDTAATDDPNGTEVTIGVRREHIMSFEAKAKSFFKFWAEGTVLLNGKPPTRFDGLKVTDDIYIDHDTPGQNKVVMGNVAYPWPQDFGLARGSVIAFVGIGEVDFPPSREALAMNDITKPTLVRVKAEFEKGLNKAVQKEITAAPSKPEAVQKMREWDTVLPYHMRNSDYTYKGETVPRMMIHPDAANGGEYFVTDSGSYRGGSHQKLEGVPYGEWNRSYYVEGFDLAGFTATHKKKLRKYCEDNDLSYPTRFILGQPKFDVSWVSNPRVIQWADVKAIKLERKVNGVSNSGRIAGSYDMFVGDDFKSGVPAADIDTTKPVYYYRGNRYGAAIYMPALAHFRSQFTIVVLPENRVEKFKRNFPAANDLYTTVSALKDAWVKGLTRDKKIALWMRENSTDLRFSALDPKKLTDPALLASIKLAKLDVTKDRAILDIVGRLFGHSMHRNPLIAKPDDWTDPLNAYPLYDERRIGTIHEDHIYIYLNAAYAAKTKEA